MQAQTASALYLDLLKRCLTNWIYADSEIEPVRPVRALPRMVASVVSSFGMILARRGRFDRERRRKGQDWPVCAHTMIGMERLDNLQSCIEHVIADGVPGDFIETGVWRGGSTIFMRGALKAHGITDRKVWVADSFAGLPPPDAAAFPDDKGDTHHVYDELRVSMEEVKKNFAAYGLLDDQVQFLKGWFKDTLPDAPIAQLAILRLDGDMYESTMQALRALYPRLSPGGFVIVDDYVLGPCAQAVHDFRAEFGLVEPISDIDGTGAFWRRSLAP